MALLIWGMASAVALRVSDSEAVVIAVLVTMVPAYALTTRVVLQERRARDTYASRGERAGVPMDRQKGEPSNGPPAWIVLMGTFSHGWPLQTLIVAIALGVFFVSGSPLFSAIGGLVLGFVCATVVFPSLARRAVGNTPEKRPSDGETG